LAVARVCQSARNLLPSVPTIVLAFFFCVSLHAEDWLETLAKTPFPTNSFRAYQTEPIDLILKSFKPTETMRGVILMPGAADQIYFFDWGQVTLPQNPNLLDAIRGFTNQAKLGFTFVAPFVLLHVQRDDLHDPLVAGEGGLLGPLEQKKIPGRSYYLDRPYDRFVPALRKLTAHKIFPTETEKGSWHYYRLAFVGHDLTVAEYVRAIAYGSCTLAVVEKNRILFEGAEAMAFKAEPFTQEGQFTEGIEGPACDRAGNVYAVNFAKQQTIGRTKTNGVSEIFATLPGDSVGNGIVFDPKGTMFIADYVGHNVLRILPGSRRVEVFAHNDQMNQPNDLALAPDGTLFASDPAWKNGTGQLWRIDPDGATTLLAANLGTSNGIDVSPDGSTLYVNESVQRNVWAWTINADRTISNKRLIRQFPDFGFDGMRCDIDGNLYISRHGKGTVVKMTPQGEVLREIDVLGSKPSNLCFGGVDGRTVYVTEVEHTRLVRFRVDRPGLAWSRWHEKKEPAK